MKSIPYDEIIAKANARKDALQRYEAALHDFVHHLPQLQAAVGACEELRAATKALDHEASHLVGWDNLYVAMTWVEKFSEAYLARHAQDSYRHTSAVAALKQLTGEDVPL